jgi:hypothetical protein
LLHETTSGRWRVVFGDTGSKTEKGLITPESINLWVFATLVDEGFDGFGGSHLMRPNLSKARTIRLAAIIPSRK